MRLGRRRLGVNPPAGVEWVLGSGSGSSSVRSSSKHQQHQHQHRHQQPTNLNEGLRSSAKKKKKKVVAFGAAGRSLCMVAVTDVGMQLGKR
jgi:hypothetical protein